MLTLLLNKSITINRTQSSGQIGETEMTNTTITTGDFEITHNGYDFKISKISSYFVFGTTFANFKNLLKNPTIKGERANDIRRVKTVLKNAGLI